MSNYLIFLGGDGDVSLVCYAIDEKDAEEFANMWIAKHNYTGEIISISELTPPDEVEL